MFWRRKKETTKDLSPENRNQSKQKKESEISLQRINILYDFAQSIDAQLSQEIIDNFRIWTINSTTQKTPLSHQVLEKYASELERIQKDDRPSGNCRKFASAANRKGITSGVLLGDETNSAFITYSTHGIGLDELPDNSLAGVDWSSREIDRFQGHYDLLVLHASTQQELLNMTQKLYGGKWWQASDEEIFKLYKASYFDSPEELHELVQKYQPK